MALGASAWSTRLNLPHAERDAIEVAALLHDVGLIGVPDQVLLKPGPLDHDETLLFEQSRRSSVARRVRRVRSGRGARCAYHFGS